MLAGAGRPPLDPIAPLRACATTSWRTEFRPPAVRSRERWLNSEYRHRLGPNTDSDSTGPSEPSWPSRNPPQARRPRNAGLGHGRHCYPRRIRSDRRRERGVCAAGAAWAALEPLMFPRRADFPQVAEAMRENAPLESNVPPFPVVAMKQCFPQTSAEHAPAARNRSAPPCYNTRSTLIFRLLRNHRCIGRHNLVIS